MNHLIADGLLVLKTQKEFPAHDLDTSRRICALGIVDSMNIRIADENDVPTVQELYTKFTGENMEGVAVLDKEIVNQSVRSMIAQKALILAELDGQAIGFMSGYFSQCHFSKDVMFASMFLFLKEGFRGLTYIFLHKVEEMLQSTDATKFVVASPAFKGSERLDALYERCGFTLLEKHYAREIYHAG